MLQYDVHVYVYIHKLISLDMLFPLDQCNNTKSDMVPCIINRWCMQFHLIDFVLNTAIAFQQKIVSAKVSQIIAKHLVIASDLLIIKWFHHLPMSMNHKHPRLRNTHYRSIQLILQEHSFNWEKKNKNKSCPKCMKSQKLQFKDNSRAKEHEILT